MKKIESANTFEAANTIAKALQIDPRQPGTLKLAQALGEQPQGDPACADTSPVGLRRKDYRSRVPGQARK